MRPTLVHLDVEWPDHSNMYKLLVLFLDIGPKANPMEIILPTKLAINHAFRCVATPVMCNMARNTSNLASGTKTQPRSRSATNPNHAVLIDGGQTDITLMHNQTRTFMSITRALVFLASILPLTALPREAPKPWVVHPPVVHKVLPFMVSATVLKTLWTTAAL